MTNDDHAPYDDADDMVATAELHELFSRRRPDPDRFAAGVAARVEAAAGPGSGPGAATSTWTRWRQRAAGLFPGLSSGDQGGFFATLLSLPVLALFAVFAMFFRSSQQLDASVERAATEPEHSKIVEALRRTLLMLLFAVVPIGGSALGLLFLDLRQGSDSATVIDTALAVVITGMALITFFLGQFVRTRGARVAEVGNFVVALQFAVLLGCVVHVGIFGVFDAGSVLGYHAAGWVLVIGVVVCGGFTFWVSREFYSLTMVVIVAVLPGALRFELPGDEPGAIRERLAAVVARLDPSELSGWDTAASMHEVLVDAGEPGVDLAAVRDRLAVELQRPKGPKGDTETSTLVLGHAHRLGLLTGDDWQSFATERLNRFRLRSLLSDSGKLRGSHLDPFFLGLAAATLELTPQQVEHVTRRVEASWPDPGTPRHDSLADALLCIQWLEHLGRDDLVAAHTDELHALLRACWISEERAATHAFPGGFGGPPAFDHPSTSTTSTALSIIERVGTPSDVPLSHVRAYLRHSARRGHREPADESQLKMLARAEHYRLVHTIGLPTPSLLELLVGERMFIATALFALLCLRALMLAHRSRSGPELPGVTTAAGALP